MNVEPLNLGCKMENYRLNNLDISLEREGAERFTKASYPIRYGRYSEIETREYLFQFNLNGDIKYICSFPSNCDIRLFPL